MAATRRHPQRAPVRARALRRAARSPLGLALIGLVLLTAAGAIITETAPETRLRVQQSLTLPLERPLDSRARFATDGDLPSDNSLLWTVTPRGTGVELRGFAVRPNRLAEERRLLVALPPGERPSSFDVSRWDRRSRGADLFAMRSTPSGVRVSVLSGERRRGMLERGEAPLPAPRRGEHRDLFVATWSGERPDLWVVDRGLPAERVRLSIFSGESRFRSSLVERRLPFLRLEPGRWSVDVGQLEQPRRDLFFFKQDPTLDGPEVHVIPGEDLLRGFSYERVLALPPNPPRPYRFAIGVLLGAATAFAIDTARADAPRVEVIQLAFPPSPE